MDIVRQHLSRIPTSRIACMKVVLISKCVAYLPMHDSLSWKGSNGIVTCLAFEGVLDQKTGFPLWNLLPNFWSPSQSSYLLSTGKIGGIAPSQANCLSCPLNVQRISQKEEWGLLLGFLCGELESSCVFMILKTAVTASTCKHILITQFPTGLDGAGPVYNTNEEEEEVRDCVYLVDLHLYRYCSDCIA